MKVLAPLFASSFFALASAHEISFTFGAPALGQQFTAGDNFNVTLVQHNTTVCFVLLFVAYYRDSLEYSS